MNRTLKRIRIHSEYLEFSWKHIFMDFHVARLDPVSEFLYNWAYDVAVLHMARQSKHNDCILQS